MILQLLDETDAYPHNLGEGKLQNAEENDANSHKVLVYSGLLDVGDVNYVMELGCLGLRDREKAAEYLSKVIEPGVNHQGAQVHLKLALSERAGFGVIVLGKYDFRMMFDETNVVQK